MRAVGKIKNLKWKNKSLSTVAVFVPTARAMECEWRETFGILLFLGGHEGRSKGTRNGERREFIVTERVGPD